MLPMNVRQSASSSFSRASMPTSSWHSTHAFDVLSAAKGDPIAVFDMELLLWVPQAGPGDLAGYGAALRRTGHPGPRESALPSHQPTQGHRPLVLLWGPLPDPSADGSRAFVGRFGHA